MYSGFDPESIRSEVKTHMRPPPPPRCLREQQLLKSCQSMEDLNAHIDLVNTKQVQATGQMFKVWWQALHLSDTRREKQAGSLLWAELGNEELVDVGVKWFVLVKSEGLVWMDRKWQGLISFTTVEGHQRLEDRGTKCDSSFLMPAVVCKDNNKHSVWIYSLIWILEPHLQVQAFRLEGLDGTLICCTVLERQLSQENHVSLTSPLYL